MKEFCFSTIEDMNQAKLLNEYNESEDQQCSLGPSYYTLAELRDSRRLIEELLTEPNEDEPGEEEYHELEESEEPI